MILLKSTLLFAAIIFFIIGISNASLVFLDRSGAQARVAAAAICIGLAFGSMIGFCAMLA